MSCWDTRVYACTHIHMHATISRMDHQKGAYHSWFPTPTNAFNTTQDWWHSPVSRLSNAPVQSSRVVAHRLERYLLYSTSLQPKKHIWKLIWPTTDDKPLPFSPHPSFCTRQLKSEVKSIIDTFLPQGPWGGGAALKSIWSFFLSQGRQNLQPVKTSQISCVRGNNLALNY